jgi:hypothetical protein
LTLLTLLGTGSGSVVPFKINVNNGVSKNEFSGDDSSICT